MADDKGKKDNEDQQDQNGRKPGEKAVLKHGRSTVISNIGPAVTTKHNKVFMLTTQSGDIVRVGSGYGLYFRDTRYLDQMEMLLDGQAVVSLLDDSAAGSQCLFELTNPEMQLQNGQTLAKEHLSIRRTYTLHHQVDQDIEIHSLNPKPAEFDVSLVFGSQFTNMFVVRGAEPGKRGTLHPPRAEGAQLLLVYDGADGHERTTAVTFSPAPDRFDGQTAVYHVCLDPRDTWKLKMKIDLEDKGAASPAHTENGQKHSPSSEAERHQVLSEILSQLPTVESDNPFFDAALSRSVGDLKMLAMAEHGDAFLAAGVPWYVALFGRDSCISAFEMLAFQPEIARSTLHVLARYQGTRYNDYQDEEPGKIPHELRVGEKANLHEVPQIPYYGTVDATPWFLILLGEYLRWTADIGTFNALEENVKRALDWIDANMQKGECGFLDYGTRSGKGLSNQGWKDSGNSIVNDDGSLAQAPIALVEVQGYVHMAWLLIASAYRVSGDEQSAQQLEKKARDLKERFNKAYWMGDKKFYALALQKEGRPAKAIASNPGQALFTGIVDDDKVQPLVDRLMADDMFCGWGIRTLSAGEVAYNPLDYQVGSVWPHDNALIALGLRRCGCGEQMSTVFTGIFEAARNFSHFRLPEVFDGFSKSQYGRPVHYPVACSPQAWAAGTLPLMLQAALGLEPEAQSHLLRIHRPTLPDWLSNVKVKGLRIGRASVDLQYHREGNSTLVAVLKRDGDLSVTVEY